CSAMDPRHTLQTMHTMRTLADQGIGVGVVLHDLNIAARYTDRAIVLDPSGRVVASGESEQALSPETLSSVFEVSISRHTLDAGRSVLTIGDPD
ncbi:MAG TPA: ABC transporter, partial [Phycisphaerales bacterium]|nr:ABC transporter [Phycisphaerales bacterium]